MFLEPPPPPLTEKICGVRFIKRLIVFRKCNGFFVVLTVFSVSTTKNLGNPFLRARGAPKIFRGLFQFRPKTPPKKMVTTYALVSLTMFF